MRCTLKIQWNQSQLIYTKLNSTRHRREIRKILTASTRLIRLERSILRETTRNAETDQPIIKLRSKGQSLADAHHSKYKGKKNTPKHMKVTYDLLIIRYMLI